MNFPSLKQPRSEEYVPQDRLDGWAGMRAVIGPALFIRPLPGANPPSSVKRPGRGTNSITQETGQTVRTPVLRDASSRHFRCRYQGTTLVVPRLAQAIRSGFSRGVVCPPGPEGPFLVRPCFLSARLKPCPDTPEFNAYLRHEVLGNRRVIPSRRVAFFTPVLVKRRQFRLRHQVVPFQNGFYRLYGRSGMETKGHDLLSSNRKLVSRPACQYLRVPPPQVRQGCSLVGKIHRDFGSPRVTQTFGQAHLDVIVFATHRLEDHIV